MYTYLSLLSRALRGVESEDRTGIGTRRVFGEYFKHDLSYGFPLLTTKKVWFKALAEEMLWFISGNDNISYLHKRGIHIWDEWAKPDGSIGPAYGYQWRNWNGSGLDQLSKEIERIRRLPHTRRAIVSAWNPSALEDMALPPCHMMFQLSAIDNRLNLQMYQRSADVCLGVPFNIAQYALLTHMIAHVLGMEPGTLSICYGDLHIYKNHIDGALEQMQRSPGALPHLEVVDRNQRTIDDFVYDDFKVTGYHPWPPIKYPIAV